MCIIEKNECSTKRDSPASVLLVKAEKVSVADFKCT